MSGQASAASLKGALRSRLLIARAQTDPDERRRAAALLRDRVLDLAALRSARTVAAYTSTASEPGTQPLLTALTDQGVTVLLPVLQPDFSLGWATHQPDQLGRQVLNRLGILEPTAPVSGADVLARVDVVICPGLAGDLHGHRLGRGGGSYDRALATPPAGVLRCLLLYDDEVLDDVPTQWHDQPVDVLVTPTRTLHV